MEVEMKNQKTSVEDSDTKRDILGIFTLDPLLRDLGHCGRFQVIFVTLGYFPLLPAAWGLMFMAFGNYNPGWQCLDETVLNSTRVLGDSLNITVPRIQDGKNQSEYGCNTIASCKNLTFNGAASTAVTEWFLVCDDSWITSFIISIEMVGVMLGAYAGGQVGDRLGRKFSIHGGAVLLALTSIVAIFSVSWKMFTVVRFFIGFACGSILSSAVVYNFEFIPAWWRSFMGVFPFWNVATLSFSLCVIIFKNWRYVHIATTVVSVIAFLPVFWLPESMRFLTVHGKLKRAKRVVQKIARLNGKSLPDTTVINTIAEIEKENMKKRSSYTYCDLFHKSIRKSSIVLGMAWFILSVGYFMIGFGIKGLSGDFFVNLLLFSVLSVPTRMISLVIATKVGRRFAAALFMCLSSVCSFSVVAIQLLASEENRDTATVAMAFGANMMMEGSWGVVAVLVVELSPTAVRNLAYGYCSGLARLGAIIAPYLIPRETLPIFGAFLLLGILQLVCFVGLLMLTETKGKSLEDNLKKRGTTT